MLIVGRHQTGKPPARQAPRDHDSQIMTDDPSMTKPVVTKAHLDELSRGIQRLQMNDNVTQTEKTPQELDQALQRCWADLGLPVEDIYENTGLPGFSF